MQNRLIEAIPELNRPKLRRETEKYLGAPLTGESLRFFEAWAIMRALPDYRQRQICHQVYRHAYRDFYGASDCPQRINVTVCIQKLFEKLPAVLENIYRTKA